MDVVGARVSNSGIHIGTLRGLGGGYLIGLFKEVFSPTPLRAPMRYWSLRYPTHSDKKGSRILAARAAGVWRCFGLRLRLHGHFF